MSTKGKIVNICMYKYTCTHEHTYACICVCICRCTLNYACTYVYTYLYITCIYFSSGHIISDYFPFLLAYLLISFFLFHFFVSSFSLFKKIFFVLVLLPSHYLAIIFLESLCTGQKIFDEYFMFFSYFFIFLSFLFK